MNQTQIDSAASFLIERRRDDVARGRLAPELRPSTNADALAIQKAIMDKMGDEVGGWKCVLPNSDIINVAPIFAATICDSSPCPIQLDNGVCRIEPEIAFKFKKDLPDRGRDYSEDEIIDALAGAHLALELIQNRYAGTEDVSYLENLADCLFNQGVYLGPVITLDKAISSAQLDFVLTQGDNTSFTGHHPNKGPLLPVLWLVNFLITQGLHIKAGQVVITGSFAGVHEVLPATRFTLEYTGLDTLSATLQA